MLKLQKHHFYFVKNCNRAQTDTVHAYTYPVASIFLPVYMEMVP